MTELTANTSAGVHWDLSTLFPDDAAARAAIPDLQESARAFRDRYRGRLAELDARELRDALDALSALDNRLSRLANYSALGLSVEISGERQRDLDAEVELALTGLVNDLRFFDLEWIALADAQAEKLIADAGLAGYAHYLSGSRRFAPHTRTEAEEEMLAEREPAASNAWHTLFDQVTSELEIEFEGRTRTLDETLSLVQHERRETRIGAYEAAFTALEPHAKTLAHVYDSIVADRLVIDRIRGYGGPRSAQDLRNELPEEAVDALLDAVERHHHLAHRWYAHKAKRMGVPKLVLADQYAPLGSSEPLSYPEATELVATSLGAFSPRLERVARTIYDERRIDAEPRSGKRGGAFCASIAQDAKPYVLMNYTERLDDAATLAHEIGHAMQFELSGERQTALTHHPPLALAEVPSTFAEMIVMDRLLAEQHDPEPRLFLLAKNVERGFATVFRQTVMVRYEQAAYSLRADGKALLPDRLCDFWLAANTPYYGDAIELPVGYRFGWSYIPHFIHTRFYTYAYVFAHLVSLALLARYREDGDAFVGPYLEFLSIGGGASPKSQLAALGLDITTPECWDVGFSELERMIGLAEQA